MLKRRKRVPYIITYECIACGSCEEICPEVFRVNEEQQWAEVIDQAGAPEEKIQEAMDNCPTGCIHWEID